jgi:minor extracellular serine protease Vpr
VNGSSLGNLRGLFGDGPKIGSPMTAQVKDVTALGNDGLACTALAAGSLTGAFALVQRGTCDYATKVNFAQAAGAVGVIIYNAEGNDDITQRLYVQNTGIPAALIGNSDGKALKVYLTANPSGTITLDPAILAADNPQVNTVAPFSSRGPSIGNFAATRDFALKPELVAPGVDVYTATQKFDPNADTYNATGYTRVSGTSFAVPFVAGVAAMAKAKNPNLNTPGRLKSAVVNTATADLQGTVHVTDAGAGKLYAVDAVAVAATLEPAAISFGPVSALPINRTLTLTNVSAASVTFNLAVRTIFDSTTAHVTLSDTVVALQPGANKLITVSLAGTKPAAGSYEGFIDVTGAGPALHLPYLYIVGSGVPYTIFPTINGGFTGVPNDTAWLLGMRVLDPFGAPVANLPVSFAIKAGGGKFDPLGGDKTTDVLGNAGVYVDLGPQQGDQIFTGTAGSYTQEFDGYARRLPAINSGGVGNAAAFFQTGPGLAPGSYISIYGSDLSDTSFLKESTVSLPVSLGQVSVSFDGGGKSLPGHLHFISPGQVNVQIPWEYQGLASVTMKVTLYGYLWGAPYTVPLATYSPGVFAVTDSLGAAITASHPAARGGVIVVYANGLGPVDTPQSSGDPASSTVLVNTTSTATATVGGAPATVQFSGLTPGFVALYQVNVLIPASAPTGTQTLQLSIGGASVQMNLPVQ